MSIYYIEHNNIDQQHWDTCVQQAANSLPYCYSWYLNIVSPKWDALVNADYSAIMPLTWKQKYGIRYLHQPFFAQQLGIFAQQPPNEPLINSFLKAIPTRFRYIDFYLNYANNCAITPTFAHHSRTNYVLSLNDQYEQLYLGYKNNVRGHLKKAKRHDSPIISGIDPSHIVQLYQQAVGNKISNLQAKQYQILTELTQKCMANNMAQTLGIYNNENQLIAAIFLIKTRKRLINLISAGNLEARNHNLMFKLIDHTIQQYANTDTILDFEGSMIKSIADFYRGFGAKETQYLHLLKNQMPTWAKWIKK
jgi:hypothetical protein